MNQENTKSKSEIYNDDLMDNKQSGSFRLNDKGILISANKELARMLGYVDAKELIGRSVSLIDLSTGDCRQATRLLEENGEVDYVTSLSRKDGNLLHALISVRKVCNHAENTTYFEGVVSDIGRQMRTGQEAEGKEEKFRELFHNIADAILIIDSNHTISGCNPAFTELFGYTEDEIAGRNAAFLFEGDQYYRSVEDKSPQNPGKIKPYIYTAGYKTKSGKPLTGETLISIMRDDSGEITGYIASIRDDSPRALAEKSLREAKEKAEEADRLKTAFIANMSHEIRTPMNAVLGFSEFLTDPDLSATELKDFVNIIKENGSALINLIDDIMDVSRIESGEMKLDLHAHEMNGVLGNIYNTIIPHFKPRTAGAIETRLVLPENERDIILQTDVQRLRQILYNLISNAFRYTDDGLIEVGYELLPGNRFSMYVKDTGIGIAGQKQKVIFERFRQADEGRNRKYSGTGIGLTITKKLVEMLQGEIRVESAEGKGSVFYCEFPGVKVKEKVSETDVKQKDAPEQGSPDLSGKTILVAEDFEANYHFLATVLKNLNANVIWCKNGKETIDAMSNGHQIDIVLMDVQMPVMSGNEAMKHIRRNGIKVPVIAQTAYATSKEVQECLESGYDDYITKPFRIKVLLDTIRKYL